MTAYEPNRHVMMKSLLESGGLEVQRVALLNRPNIHLDQAMSSLSRKLVLLCLLLCFVFPWIMFL